MRRSAQSRNIDFKLTIKEIWNLFIKQNRQCAISGVKLQFSQTKKLTKQGLNTASLDRINNNKSYNINNVWWTHKYVNLMKRNFDLKYFLYLCSLINNPIKHSKPYKSTIIKNKRSNAWLGFGNMPMNHFSRIKRQCIRGSKIIEFNLMISDIWHKFVEQKGYCALTGLPLNLETYQSTVSNNASLDRIDSTKNYSKNNTEWIHKDVNMMKWTLSSKELLCWCKLITNNTILI